MAERDLYIFRGDDRTLALVARDYDDAIINIVGATIKFTVRGGHGSGGKQLFQRTVGTGITITDGANGKFDVAIVPANTNGVDAGQFVYDVEVTVSSKTTTTHRGTFIVKEGTSY